MAPLTKSTSKKAFSKNIKAEVGAGKPVKQAVAIAYSEKREAGKKQGTSDGYMVKTPGRIRQPGKEISKTRVGNDMTNK